MESQPSDEDDDESDEYENDPPPHFFIISCRDSVASLLEDRESNVAIRSTTNYSLKPLGFSISAKGDQMFSLPHSRSSPRSKKYKSSAPQGCAEFDLLRDRDSNPSFRVQSATSYH